MKQRACGLFPFPARSSLISLVVGILACSCLTGCGQGADSLSHATVSGTVLVRGEFLESGLVRFVPIGQTKGPVTTAKVTDGCFSLTADAGPVAGTHRVEIAATDFFGFDPGDQKAAEQAKRSSGKPVPRNPIPLRYRRNNSPLRAKIEPQHVNNLIFTIGSGRLRS